MRDRGAAAGCGCDALTHVVRCVNGAAHAPSGCDPLAARPRHHGAGKLGVDTVFYGIRPGRPGRTGASGVVQRVDSLRRFRLGGKG